MTMAQECRRQGSLIFRLQGQEELQAFIEGRQMAEAALQTLGMDDAQGPATELIDAARLALARDVGVFLARISHWETRLMCISCV